MTIECLFISECLQFEHLSHCFLFYSNLNENVYNLMLTLYSIRFILFVFTFEQIDLN